MFKAPVLFILGFLSSSVFAADTLSTPQKPSMLSNFFPLIIIVVIVLFFFWSQRRRSAQTNKMLSALAEGDEIAISNGLMGKIVKISDQALTLEIAEGVNIKVQKTAVFQVLPKGTLSAI